VSADLIIRPSSLVTYLDCPRRWSARHLRDHLAAAGYTVNAERAAGAGALVGSGVHAGAGWTLECMKAGSGPGTDADAAEQAVIGLRQRIEAEGAEWDDTSPTPNVAEKQVVRMTRVYRHQVAVDLRPVLIEERAEAEFAPGLVLSGQLDLMAADAGDDGDGLHDLKTGRMRRMNAVQYGAYSMIFQAHGFNIRRIAEDYIKRVPLRDEQPPAETHAIDVAQARQDAWSVLGSIKRDVAEFAMRAANPKGEAPINAFLPNPASALCSARWCPAFGTDSCRSHRR
jgi:hypothetical protein